MSIGGFGLETGATNWTTGDTTRSSSASCTSFSFSIAASFTPATLSSSSDNDSDIKSEFFLPRVFVALSAANFAALDGLPKQLKPGCDSFSHPEQYFTLDLSSSLLDEVGFAVGFPTFALW